MEYWKGTQWGFKAVVSDVLISRIVVPRRQKYHVLDRCTPASHDGEEFGGQFNKQHSKFYHALTVVMMQTSICTPAPVKETMISDPS